LWGVSESLTIDDVEIAAGVDGSLIARAWRAAGCPEPHIDPERRSFSRRDVEMLQIMRAAIDLFGEDVAIQLLRVVGAAAARVADASVSAFFVSVASAAVEADPSGLALARANAESMMLLDGLSRGFDTWILSIRRHGPSTSTWACSREL
jgi:class 3 adenylate cyclase